MLLLNFSFELLIFCFQHVAQLGGSLKTISIETKIEIFHFFRHNQFCLLSNTTNCIYTHEDKMNHNLHVTHLVLKWKKCIFHSWGLKQTTNLHESLIGPKIYNYNLHFHVIGLKWTQACIETHMVKMKLHSYDMSLKWTLFSYFKLKF